MHAEMRILVAGPGSIGRRHLANVRKLLPHSSIAVWRRERTREGLDAFDVEAIVTSESEAMAWGAHAAIIASPAPCHVEMGMALARAGAHLFMEKPFAHALEGVDALIDECRRLGLTLMTGYPLRFHQGLRCLKRAVDEGKVGRPLTLRAEVGQYLPDWRPGTDYRKGLSASRGDGGGALLELSHEIDLARWLLGDVASVCAMCGRLSDLELEVEDTAEILLRFKGGAIGGVSLDFFQIPSHRFCAVRGTLGTVEWSLAARQTRLCTSSTGEWETLRPDARDGLHGDMFLEELRHFLDCIHSREPSLSTGEDGREALRIVLAARRSAAEHREISP